MKRNTLDKLKRSRMSIARLLEKNLPAEDEKGGESVVSNDAIRRAIRALMK